MSREGITQASAGRGQTGWPAPPRNQAIGPAVSSEAQRPGLQDQCCHNEGEESPSSEKHTACHYKPGARSDVLAGRQDRAHPVACSEKRPGLQAPRQAACALPSEESNRLANGPLAAGRPDGASVVERALGRHLHAKCFPPILGPGLPADLESHWAFKKPQRRRLCVACAGPGAQAVSEGGTGSGRCGVTTSLVLLASHCWIIRRGLSP